MRLGKVAMVFLSVEREEDVNGGVGQWDDTL
jgi:hypothetical protein